MLLFSVLEQESNYKDDAGSEAKYTLSGKSVANNSMVENGNATLPELTVSD